jgi:FkbM family methyltransferase
MIKEYYCIDGDKDFFSFLRENLSSIEGVFLINSFLSATIERAKNLVKIHPGSASSQGNEEINTTSLDQLLIKGELAEFDLIKIDVDGYDGRVLLGAKESLIKNKPHVIFEWHPILCLETGNNWLDHFIALEECGYDRFIFFDNYGNFSHFMTSLDYKSINLLAQVCTSKNHLHAVYFDIVAIHESSEFNLYQLATLEYSRSNKHPY